MRVPLSWLREYAPVADSISAAEVGRALTAAGLEVETIEAVGHDISGVVVGQVLEIEELAANHAPSSSRCHQRCHDARCVSGGNRPRCSRCRARR